MRLGREAGVRVAQGAAMVRLERAVSDKLPSQGLVKSDRNLVFFLRAVQISQRNVYFV